MEELKNQIMEKLGINPEQAGGAIQMVLNFVKDKLPENLRGLVDNALTGEGGGASNLLDQAKGALGGFFK